MMPDGAPDVTLPGAMAPGTTSGATSGGSLPLRLRAEDAEDLAVISACLQDALVAVRDLAYDPGARVFVLVANRFRWEDCHPGTLHGGPVEGGKFERILCGVTFDNVTAAAYRGFQRAEKDRILCLLAIRLAAGAATAAPGLTIDLDFAGQARIRLTASSLRCRVRDFGDPWPTSWQPGHELSTTG
jgi:Protein of unknown function (DUF2948)